MGNSFLFKFKTDISSINISLKLNNPFNVSVAEIAKIAAKEFQEVITLKESRKQKSIGLQKRLFENYNFLNLS